MPMLPAEYKIRELVIHPATMLAPMAGVTDTLFRRVIRGLGSCGLLMTEFTSSEASPAARKRRCAISISRKTSIRSRRSYLAQIPR